MPHRRTSRRFLVMSMILVLTGVMGSGAQEEPVQLNEITSETWMTQWMGGTKAPVGALHLRRFKDPIYIVSKDIGWKPEPGQEVSGPVSVPKGFVTDFASIPPVFFSLLRPDGDYTYPAIIHDYLYWTQTGSREEADHIFRWAMQDFGINKAVAWVVYQAVRWGGGFAWEKNAKDKANGECRILQKFPQDPRTTWETWKARKGVFADCESNG